MCKSLTSTVDILRNFCHVISLPPCLWKLLDSESVAANCRSRCKEQRIPFYRFSPTLETVIASGETDDQKLIEMLTRTKLEATNKWTNELKELVELFHTVAEMSKKQRLLHLRHQRRARLLWHSVWNASYCYRLQIPNNHINLYITYTFFTYIYQFM